MRKKVGIALAVLVITLMLAAQGNAANPVPIKPIAAPYAHIPPAGHHLYYYVDCPEPVYIMSLVAKYFMDRLGGTIDMATGEDTKGVDCYEYAELYSIISDLPLFYADKHNPHVWKAVTIYNQAVLQVDKTSKDMYLHCADYLKGQATDKTVPFIQWGLSREGIFKSVLSLYDAMEVLKYAPRCRWFYQVDKMDHMCQMGHMCQMDQMHKMDKHDKAQMDQYYKDQMHQCMGQMGQKDMRDGMSGNGDDNGKED